MLKKVIQQIILFATLLVILVSPVQSQFLCGDVNETGDINVSDLVYMVNFVFKGGAEPLPYLSGDCDLSGDVNVTDLVFMVSYIFRGGPEPCSQPSGELVDYVGCFKSLNATDTIESNWDCLEYEYDGGSTLTLNHINAGFNCCAIVGAEIIIEDSLIMIVESETFDSLGPCFCLCLFDLEFEIINLPPGTYTIVVEEVALYEEDFIEFTINLTTTPITDSYCVFRDHYPWGW